MLTFFMDIVEVKTRMWTS